MPIQNPPLSRLAILGVAFALLPSACRVEEVDRGHELAQAALGEARSLPSAQNFFRGEARAAALREVTRLRAIQARHQAFVRAQPGVIGMGIGLDRTTGGLDFLVTVERGAPAPKLEPIEGVPVRTRSVGKPAPSHGGSGCQPCHDDLFSLPVEMGNSAHTEAVSAAGGGCFAGICSLGFKACDLWREEDVFVTAAHCATSTSSSCAGSAGFGAPVFHRSPGDALSCTPEDYVGEVAEERPPLCNVQNIVDATSVESDASLTELRIRDVGVPSAYAGTALPGDLVQKSGRTTGHTLGTVDLVGYAVSVTDPGYCGCSMDFDDQLLILPDPLGSEWALSGDSGSAVLDQAATPAIVGLNFLMMDCGVDGICGIANSVQNVLTELDLSTNLLDCLDPCAALFASGRMAEPRVPVVVSRSFRDGVLAQSPRGRRYIETYYRFTGAIVELMSERPLLLARTVSLFGDVLPVLEAVTRGDSVAIPRSRIEAVARLFGDYAAVASDQALRGALLDLRRDLMTPEVLREFGVRIE